jgi:hypothetical protein
MSTWSQLIRQNRHKVIEDKVRMWAFMTSFRQRFWINRDASQVKSSTSSCPLLLLPTSNGTLIKKCNRVNRFEVFFRDQCGFLDITPCLKS